MSLTIPISCASDAFCFCLFLFFFICYIFCHRTNQISLMMILKNLGLTPDPLVQIILAIFLCVLKIPLVVLVFWGLAFSHHQESRPKVVDSLNYFGAKIPDSPSKFQN